MTTEDLNDKNTILRNKNLKMNKALLFTSALIVFLVSCTSSEEDKQENTVEKKQEVFTQKTELEQLNEAIIAQPNNATVYVNRANYFLNNGQVEDAKQDADRALKIDKTSAEVSYTKGLVMLKSGQVENAKLFFEHATELDTAHARSYLKLAYIYLAVPDFDKSIAYINKGLRINQYMAEPYWLKGKWYELQNKNELAASSYQTAIERDPDYYDAYLSQGILHNKLDNPIALQYFQSAINLRPNSIEAWRLKGMSHKEHEEYSKAIVIFDTIIAIDSTFEVAYFDKGTTLLDMCYESNPKAKNDSLINEALTLFNKAINLNANYVPARYNRGLCYEELGQKNKAKEEYKKVLELEPNYELAVQGMNRL